MGALIPLFIIPSEYNLQKVSFAPQLLTSIAVIENLTGAWAVSTFGFISAAFAPIPWMLYLFGARLRANSKYNPALPMNMMKDRLGHDEEMQMQEMQMQGMQNGMQAE